jgi:hypothetical protein
MVPVAALRGQPDRARAHSAKPGQLRHTGSSTSPNSVGAQTVIEGSLAASSSSSRGWSSGATAPRLLDLAIAARTFGSQDRFRRSAETDSITTATLAFLFDSSKPSLRRDGRRRVARKNR